MDWEHWVLAAMIVGALILVLYGAIGLDKEFRGKK
jgi:hypothetical protein